MTMTNDRLQSLSDLSIDDRVFKDLPIDYDVRTQIPRAMFKTVSEHC